jgi:uncharacterized protein YggL (DUF469 family)
MTQPKTRNRRLRKKLYLDEFQVKGFGLACQITSDDQDKLDAFFDGLITLIESRDLSIGGGGNEDKFQGYIIGGGRYDSATEEDREAVLQWLESQEIVSDCSVDGLTDAYYGDE